MLVGVAATAGSAKALNATKKEEEEQKRKKRIVHYSSVSNGVHQL